MTKERNNKWAKDNLGRNEKQDLWYAYPTTMEGVSVRVESEFPEDVVAVANLIEQAASS
jgi:hypothetical protein